MKPKIVVILGPTATGKTKLAIALSKLYGGKGEVISADSMQIYKHMDIGTAKPSLSERDGITHHLIDIVEPSEEFSLADYLKKANECAEDILKRGGLPVLTGGTGLYITSFINNIKLSDTSSDEQYRNFLIALANKEGGYVLKQLLFNIDRETCERLSENDIKRLSRSMEVYKSTKKTISYHNAVSKNTESSYDFRIIGLNYRDRDKLYDKINARVDEMIKNGLIEEIERLDLNKLSSTAKQAIGYKQFIEFYKNEDPAKSIEQVIEKIKQESRHYAKRQLTWFRKDERINWINVDENNFDEILQKSKKVIEKP